MCSSSISSPHLQKLKNRQVEGPLVLVTKANWNQASWISDLFTNYKPEVSTMMLRKGKSCALCEKHHLGPFHAHSNGLTQISEKTQKFPWKMGEPLHLRILASALHQRWFLPQHVMQKRSSSLSRPKRQPHVSHSNLTGSMTPRLPPSSYNSLFKNNFSSRVYHI